MGALSFESLAIVLAAIAVGSYLKGAIGLGLPIIAIPTLAAFLGAQHAVVVITLPTFFSNVWICWRYRKMKADIPYLKVALIAACLGTIIGTFVLRELTDIALLWLLIVWIGAYLLNMIFNPDFRLKGEAARRASPFLAAIAGISQGATGIAGPVVATWIHSYRLEKELYVFGVSILFLVIATTHLAAVAGLGLLDFERLVQGAVAIIPTIIFTQIGMWTTRYMSAALFNKLVILFIVVMEIKLIWQVLEI
ncbi:MAG: sulfite exporter TauE/SafE family protein [Rhodospirillaceae bacterium]